MIKKRCSQRTNRKRLCSLLLVLMLFSFISGVPATGVYGESGLALQAESFQSMSGITSYPDKIGSCDPGDWVCFSNVSLGSGYAVFTARYGRDCGGTGTVEIRLDSPSGTLAGTLTTSDTGGWDTFLESSAPLTGASGTHSIYMRFSGGTTAGNFDWFRFSAQPELLLQAESYSSMSGVYQEPAKIGSCDPGDWVCFQNVNLSNGYPTFTARYGRDCGGTGTLEIRLDSRTGTLAGTLPVSNTGGWDSFMEVSTSLTGAAGIHNVYICFTGTNTAGNFDWFKFSSDSAAAVYNVTGLIAGTTVTEAQKWSNTTAINNTIITAGQNGGGIIRIPAGTYCVTGNTCDACIKIDYDNITLQGAGKTQTILKTRGEFIAGTPGGRATGIKIYGPGEARGLTGTDSIQTPRKNIVIRDMELDGGAGWTGNYDYNYELGSENGWDISHHAIVVCADVCVDNVTLENLYIHRYRGEMVWAGGFGLGRFVMRNCSLEDTNASCLGDGIRGTSCLVENNTFGANAPVRFWMELSARRTYLPDYLSSLGTYLPNDGRHIFQNNQFSNSCVDSGIVLCQGDAQTVSFTFENNTFNATSHALFGFMGGVGGPVTITGNNINNCSSWVMLFLESGNTLVPTNGNILFQGNTINSSQALAELRWDSIHDVTISGNSFYGTNPQSPGVSHSVVYGNNPNLTNIQVTGNTFHDCTRPEGTAGGITFSNNTYINCVN